MRLLVATSVFLPALDSQVFTAVITWVSVLVVYVFTVSLPSPTRFNHHTTGFIASSSAFLLPLTLMVGSVFLFVVSFLSHLPLRQRVKS